MKNEVQTITAEALKAKVDAGASCSIIDVRPAVLFRGKHLQIARNIGSFDQLQEEMKSRSGNEPAYLICGAGKMSQTACKKLSAAGVDGIVNVEGGTEACAKAGIPVVQSEEGVSIERQVRIAAGILVLVGVALGFLVHPGFFGLSAFVGAGLTFAGITNTCGMAMLLVRMPWNR